MARTDSEIRVSVEAVVEDERWHRIDLQELGQTACSSALTGFGMTPGHYEIGLLGCDDRRMEELNGRFRSVFRPTNVLAWPSAGDLGKPGGVSIEPHGLGDIALAWETCSLEAEMAGRQLAHHVTHLAVHGCLHLLGCRHGDDETAAFMEDLEVAILARLGIENPYWT